METSYVIEQLEIIRRAAERGQDHAWDLSHKGDRSCLLDVFQHIIDEAERIKLHIENSK